MILAAPFIRRVVAGANVVDVTGYALTFQLESRFAFRKAA